VNLTPTELEAGLWGVIGAAGSLVILYGLPEGYRLAGGRARPTLAGWRVLGVILILACTLFLGGLAASFVGASEPKEAIAAGLAWQSTLVGAEKSRRPPQRSLSARGY